MLAEILEIWGHEVRVAHEGETAIHEADVLRPDVILLDIGLPDLDGYEVARRLRANQSLAGVPLVALTGYGQEDDRRRAREAGIDLHLTKPVEPPALRRLLAEMSVRSG
jgi:CheY-like chemotaxis protein